MFDAINCKNDLNSLLTNLEPLSDTTISGKPGEAKVDLILSMVTLEVAEFTQWISIHLEWASMISKNIFPIKGPTLSTSLATKGSPAIPKAVMANREGCFGDSDK